jgi:16S rRNA (adenine1518-N6/adenine1519-N6)-dimethyltransferase
MIFAKKSLGQNFLRSTKALRQIVEAAKLEKGDWVLEIGPGEGVLTADILKSGAKVTAVEKDDRLIPVLTEKFKEEIKNGQLELLHGDALEIPFETIGLETGKFKVVANIPYYITGLLLPLILGGKIQPSLAVVLVQKEVAVRALARDKKESILSMSIKVYGKPRIVDTVPAGAFAPAPTVDSAILCIENISKDFFNTNPKISEDAFFETVKSGFAHKRKLLRANLELTDEKMTLAGLSPLSRAEDISLQDWKLLTLARLS